MRVAHFEKASVACEGRTSSFSWRAIMTAELLEAIPGITPYVSLLGPDGRRDSTGAFADLVADVGPAELLALYRDMVIIRRIDTEATALQRQGELGLWPPLLGQEAAQIG